MGPSCQAWAGSGLLLRNRSVARGGQIWPRSFVHLPRTATAADLRSPGALFGVAGGAPWTPRCEREGTLWAAGRLIGLEREVLWISGRLNGLIIGHAREALWVQSGRLSVQDTDLVALSLKKLTKAQREPLIAPIAPGRTQSAQRAEPRPKAEPRRKPEPRPEGPSQSDPEGRTYKGPGPRPHPIGRLAPQNGHTQNGPGHRERY
jgi:hypothetical protein